MPLKLFIYQILSISLDSTFYTVYARTVDFNFFLRSATTQLFTVTESYECLNRISLSRQAIKMTLESKQTVWLAQNVQTVTLSQ